MVQLLSQCWVAFENSVIREFWWLPFSGLDRIAYTRLSNWKLLLFSSQKWWGHWQCTRGHGGANAPPPSHRCTDSGVRGMRLQTDWSQGLAAVGMAGWHDFCTNGGAWGCSLAGLNAWPQQGWQQWHGVVPSRLQRCMELCPLPLHCQNLHIAYGWGVIGINVWCSTTEVYISQVKSAAIYIVT